MWPGSRSNELKVGQLLEWLSEWVRRRRRRRIVLELIFYSYFPLEKGMVSHGCPWETVASLRPFGWSRKDRYLKISWGEEGHTLTGVAGLISSDSSYRFFRAVQNPLGHILTGVPRLHCSWTLPRRRLDKVRTALGLRGGVDGGSFLGDMGGVLGPTFNLLGTITMGKITIAGLLDIFTVQWQNREWGSEWADPPFINLSWALIGPNLGQELWLVEN